MTAKQTRPQVSKRRSDIDVSDMVRQLDQLSRRVTTLETKEASRVVEMPAGVEKAIQAVHSRVQEVDRQGTSKWNALLADHRGLDERMKELQVQVNTSPARMEQQETARRQDCAELQRRETHHGSKLGHRISTLEKVAHECIPTTQNQLLESRVERAAKWIDKLKKTLDVQKGAATHEVDSLGARLPELERHSVHMGFYDVQKSQNLQHKKKHPFKYLACCKLCLGDLCPHTTCFFASSTLKIGVGRSSTAWLRPKNTIFHQKAAIFCRFFP